jgi:hypothetical protein
MIPLDLGAQRTHGTIPLDGLATGPTNLRAARQLPAAIVPGSRRTHLERRKYERRAGFELDRYRELLARQFPDEEIGTDRWLDSGKGTWPKRTYASDRKCQAQEWRCWAPRLPNPVRDPFLAQQTFWADRATSSSRDARYILDPIKMTVGVIRLPQTSGW